IERGKPVEERVKDVEYSFLTGKVSASSNVQFGGGGAGTFSDGKLTTGVNDPEGRAGFVLECFVEHGAPADIQYEAYPHIGTDRLRSVLVSLRRTLTDSGCEFHFGTRLSTLNMSGSKICGAGFDGMDDLPADVVVLAPGHSARDTFVYLKDRGIPMAAKDFAVGLRVVHEQSLIDLGQYGTGDPVKIAGLGLKPASYKLTYRCSSGRGAYTFCMCPGGYVVNAASMPETAVVNGMSEYARDSGAANSAVVMTVSGADFGTDSILAGMLFQQKLEEKAYLLGNSAIPVSDLEAFINGREPVFGERTAQLAKSIKGPSHEAMLSRLYGERLNADFAEAMAGFGKRIRGFDSGDTLLAGPESRTSSPVRILRDENFESPVKGLFPCGEGAGYAGGIMSAAMDGMKVAEEIIRRFAPPAAG
ncbi:MAG: FAD-dependent oxidoreductase, partial [Lachnospiraceae bacterium]|nr:FAD-dependent oxidoreductase [Lachnospiraceae bacterium]